MAAKEAKWNWLDTDGPSTGNLRPYSNMPIPMVRESAANAITAALVLKNLKANPMLKPSSPVVQGNTMISEGCRNKSRHKVAAYAITPE